jgi:hypothetical protein
MLAELRHLIQEQHPAMGQADLAGPRPPWPDRPSGQGGLPAADQAGLRDGVVRRAKRALPDQRRIRRQHIGYGVDARGVKRLAQGHARQDRWQGAGEERLAGPGRTGHQDVMRPGRRHFQRPLNTFLTLNTNTKTTVCSLL